MKTLYRPPLFAIVLIGSAVGLVNSLSWLFPSLFLCSIVGQAILLIVAIRLSVWHAGAVGLISGMVALGIAFHWAPYSIRDTTNLTGWWPEVVFVLLIGWEAIVFAGWCVGVSWLTKQHRDLIWLSPWLWVVLEYFWPRIFPWSLAHTHTEFLPMLQFAEFGGTSLVSGLVVLVVCTVTAIVFRSGLNPRYTAVAVATVAISLLVGHWRVMQIELQASQSEQLQVAALQVDPVYVEAVATLQKMSQSLDDQVDLIVWPETSLGHYEDMLTHFRDPLLVAEYSEAPNPAPNPTDGLKKTLLLAGGKVYRHGARDVGPYLNTALLISPSRDIIGRYVKRSLMPIGEYIPLGDQFPILKEWAAITTPLIPGDNDEPIQLPSGQAIGTLICYEDMERANARRTTLCGAECLVVLINGSGFEDEDALRQHQRLAMLRSVENRRGMLRCGATGLSCYISPTGRVEQQLPMFTQGQIVASIPMFKQLTLYSRWGEWFTWLSTILVVATIALFARRAAGKGRLDLHETPAT